MFNGVYVGIETEDKGASKFEMAIDSSEFVSDDAVVDGILHWKCLDNDEWRSKRGREFVRGQVALNGTFRIAGHRCKPANGMISCSIYLMNITADGSEVRVMCKDADDMCIMRRLRDEEAKAWRELRRLQPDCNESGQVPVCPQGHDLEHTQAVVDGHPCDICFRGFPCGAPLFGCPCLDPPCNYDVCPGCILKAQHR